MPFAVPFPKLLLRKRLWIGVCVLALVGGIYFYTRLDELSDDEVTAGPLPEFHWIPLVNLSRLDRCRNSEQGHILMVDELGYVCSLSDVLPSGCCSQKPGVSTRYDCSGCLSNGCCAVYEYCISCCLHPDKQPLLLSILTRATESYHPLFSSIRDQFELCLAKCRTSSQSVQHENTYRNPKAKHCYGTDAPTLLPEIKQEDH